MSERDLQGNGSLAKIDTSLVGSFERLLHRRLQRLEQVPLFLLPAAEETGPRRPLFGPRWHLRGRSGGQAAQGCRDLDQMFPLASSSQKVPGSVRVPFGNQDSGLAGGIEAVAPATGWVNRERALMITTVNRAKGTYPTTCKPWLAELTL
uniref:Uncharacterized protein n=1 Tax=Thermogemmatispora argillosa TaxID=2045280 RepID=A0A455T506_9CHLR|nr:hypothetical protein KTA_33270 [Thermogemmatispora argillosa]